MGIIHGYSHTATSSLTLLNQIKRQLSHLNLHCHHIQGDALQSIAKAIPARLPNHVYKVSCRHYYWQEHADALAGKSLTTYVTYQNSRAWGPLPSTTCIVAFVISIATILKTCYAPARIFAYGLFTSSAPSRPPTAYVRGAMTSAEWNIDRQKGPSSATMLWKKQNITCGWNIHESLHSEANSFATQMGFVHLQNAHLLVVQEPMRTVQPQEKHGTALSHKC